MTSAATVTSEAGGRALEELRALVALVEVRQEVSEGELRSHLLRLLDRLEGGDAAAERADPDAALRRLDSRLVEVTIDVQSLRRESSERLANLQAQLDALTRR